MRVLVLVTALTSSACTSSAPVCPPPAFDGALTGRCASEGSTTCNRGSLFGCGGGCWRYTATTCLGPTHDAGMVLDAPPVDGSPSMDGGASDAGGGDGGGTDAETADVTAPDTGAADTGPPDAGPPDAGPPDAGVPDAGVPATATYCVDIDVSNTCEMSVSPRDITIPAGQTAYFCWRNRSADYPVDVWLSYGGGYTDLAPGATWNEPPGHCLGPLVHDEHADISTACSSFRFLIHCL